jgi:hypothetical protein
MDESGQFSVVSSSRDSRRSLKIRVSPAGANIRYSKSA